MAQTLQLGSLTTDDMNQANATLQGSLDALQPDVELTVAISLWRHGSTPLAPAFLQLNEDGYGATLGNLEGPAGTVLGDPNTWIAAATQGLIPQALPPDFDASELVALILNVLDHPFFFAIHDNQTGILLFAGVVQDPS